MNKDNNMNFYFCIIPNPFATGNRNIIFITKFGETFLNKSIVNSELYQKTKNLIEGLGYVETNNLQFESSNNSNNSSSIVLEVIKIIEDFGLTYSREFEVNIIKDFNLIKEHSDFDFDADDMYFDNSLISSETLDKLKKTKSGLSKYKYKSPEVSEKISLYFYLFLNFGFSEYGRPMIHLGGDFYDSEDSDFRNYIKIVKSDFERIDDKDKPNSIILKSCKTQSDLLKEIGMFYSGYFKYQKRFEKNGSMMLQEKKFTYKLSEVTRFLNPEQSIVIETNRLGFDNLINLSKNLKYESIKESKKHITIKEINHEAEELSYFLTKKMEALSDSDEFEDAAKIKKNIDSIKKKSDMIKKMNKDEITMEEYFKLFSLN